MADTTDIHYTYALCRWAGEMHPAAVTDGLFEQARLRTLDWLGCTIGAMDAPPVNAMIHITHWLGGERQCTLIGQKEPVSLLNAIFVNASAGHVLEYDDVNKPSISHPGAAVIPTALAVGEVVKASFEQYAAAVIAGYEVVVRLGTVLNPSLYDFWHTTSACGIFAAAITAGKLLGLDAETLERTAALAGMMASGLVYGFGTDAKLVNVGHAAAAGTLAALLAREGLTAPEAVLESPKGYGAAVSNSRDFFGLLPKLGEPYGIEESYFKLHSSCGHTHTSIDACHALMTQRPFSWQDVEEIHVYTYRKAVELVGEFRHDTPARAKFSLPYCLAAKILYGSVTLNVFEENVLRDDRIAGLASRITVSEDPSYTVRYPEIRQERVEITLKNGERLIGSCELPEGKNPDISVIQKKFYELSTRAITPESAEAVCKKLLSASRQTEVSALMKTLREVVYCGKQHD